MLQMNQESYTNGTMSQQEANQLSQALYSYCKVMRVPKMGPLPAILTIFEGVIITLLMVAMGMSLWKAVLIGVIVSAVFVFLFWLAYRYRTGASKRFNSYLAVDGGWGILYDFAVAQPYVDDQFRLGRYYLFIKNGAVLRRDSINDIVRIITHYRALPTGVYLTAKVKDEYGSMAAPLCRLHMLKAGTEIDEIRSAVMQRE